LLNNKQKPFPNFRRPQSWGGFFSGRAGSGSGRFAGKGSFLLPLHSGSARLFVDELDYGR